MHARGPAGLTSRPIRRPSSPLPAPPMPMTHDRPPVHRTPSPGLARTPTPPHAHPPPNPTLDSCPSPPLEEKDIGHTRHTSSLTATTPADGRDKTCRHAHDTSRPPDPRGDWAGDEDRGRDPTHRPRHTPRIRPPRAQGRGMGDRELLLARERSTRNGSVQHSLPPSVDLGAWRVTRQRHPHSSRPRSASPSASGPGQAPPARDRRSCPSGTRSTLAPPRRATHPRPGCARPTALPLVTQGLVLDAATSPLDSVDDVYWMGNEADGHRSVPGPPGTHPARRYGPPTAAGGEWGAAPTSRDAHQNDCQSSSQLSLGAGEDLTPG